MSRARGVLPGGARQVRRRSGLRRPRAPARRAAAGGRRRRRSRCGGGSSTCPSSTSRRSTRRSASRCVPTTSPARASTTTPCPTSSPSSSAKGLARRQRGRDLRLPARASRAATASRCRSSCASRTAATATRRPTWPRCATASATLGARRAGLRRRLAAGAAPGHGVRRPRGWPAGRASPYASSTSPSGRCWARDKKMLKTRAGDTVQPGRSARRGGRARRRGRRGEAPRARPGDAARASPAAVGIGAVKYADLSSDRIKDYVFDWDRMLALRRQHRAVPQYAHARIRSILRKGADLGARSATAPSAIDEPAERALALALLEFRATVERTADTLQPHQLCAYLYGSPRRSRRSTSAARCSRPRRPRAPRGWRCASSRRACWRRGSSCSASRRPSSSDPERQRFFGAGVAVAAAGCTQKRPGPPSRRVSANRQPALGANWPSAS